MKRHQSNSAMLAITSLPEDREEKLFRETNTIFRLTGIHTEESSKTPFSISQFKTRLSIAHSRVNFTSKPTRKIIKNRSVEFKNKKERLNKTVNWEDFLKSDAHLGNIFIASQPSENLQAKLREVDNKIDR